LSADLDVNNDDRANWDRRSGASPPTIETQSDRVTGNSATPESVFRPLPVSTGLICLCVVAGQRQRNADPQQLARSLGWDPTAAVTESQLRLAAKELGLKAKSARIDWDRLGVVHLPAIAELKGGEYAVLLRCDRDGQVVVGDPRTARPRLMTQSEFESIWSGKLLLVKSRLRIDDPNRPFSLSWFGPAI
jgi:subfamily B ATP-binding cassette protein HlyB/CyaB